MLSFLIPFSICILIFIIISAKKYYKYRSFRFSGYINKEFHYYNIKDDFFATLCAGLISSFIFGIFLLLLLSENFDTVLQKSKTINIVSIKSSNSLEGTFVFGCGTIDNKFIYRVFYKNANGGIADIVLESYKTEIFEDCNKEDEARIDFYDGVFDSTSSKNKKLKWFSVFPKGSNTNLKYEIHIPKESIKYSFNVTGE